MQSSPTTCARSREMGVAARIPTRMHPAYRASMNILHGQVGSWWRQRSTGVRAALARAGLVASGLASAHVVAEYIGLILPHVGPWWGIGAGTVAWALLSAPLFLVHSVWSHWRRRRARLRPGAWTWAVEQSRVPETVGSIALSGAAAAIAVTTSVGHPVLLTTAALVLAPLAAAALLLAWYGSIAWRRHRTKESGNQDLRGLHCSPAAEWIGGPNASRQRGPTGAPATSSTKGREW